MIVTQSDFNKNLKKSFFFEKFPKIAVAVSGGPDSMALVFLLKNWVLKNNGSLIALIVDHQIRKDSNLEAKNIRKYLFKNKIESKLFKVDKKNVVKKNMKEARKNRFNKLFNFCNKNSIFHLFIGHHADDNLETYLLRKLAGSNFEGLRCMQQKVIIEKIQILRPLLLFNKKDILEYNIKNDIYYIQDPSNVDLKYSRIAVREFLLDKNKFNKQIKKEFSPIQIFFPKYKEMLFNIFNRISIDITKNKILVNFNFFRKYNLEIQIKLIDIIYKFLKPKKINLRYQKTLHFIQSLNNKKTLSSNLGGMNIKKDMFSIMFYV